MSNPLLERHELPPFSSILPEHAEPAVHKIIERNKASIEQLLADNENYSWSNLVQVIEDLDDELSRCFSPVGHLNGTLNSDALREAYNQCLPLLSAYGTWMGQHKGLYEAYHQISESAEFPGLELAQRTAIEHALRDFRLAGVALPESDKQRYGELKKRLSKLGSAFSENVLDATNAWSKELTADDLKGLPETALASAREAGRQAGVAGNVINLNFPSLQPVMTYCDDAALREEVYYANNTRASASGPNAGEWDNTALIEEILNLRLELAQLLGFNNYAELSLATKMADSTEQVHRFLSDLAARSKEQAQKEWQELELFARERHGKDHLDAWDVAYFSEKLRQQKYQISQEEIRPYFPVSKVLPGLFEVVERLYQIQVSEQQTFDSYHPDVRLFDVMQGGQVIARFYLDLYARADKRGGAWMDDCRVRRIFAGKLQIPVAYLVCNFTPPIDDTPSLLTERELTTLFHEFGHGLHHMLTRQTVAAVSGINGVAWDAVELPSQFLENWCWEEEALGFISGHFETGEPLPRELLDRMLAARNFQSAMTMVRQLEFSLFDFQLHRDWDTPAVTSVQALLDEVRSEVAVFTPPEYSKFQNAFSHIFAGGYAAGYYSYKWAEVLSADAFSRFEEEGIFNPETGRDFRRHILEVGGSIEAQQAFVAFRGREPDIEALLRHSGIAA